MTCVRIDARGRSCPEPVLLAKKGLEQNKGGIEVLVDNSTARDNVSRFGRLGGYRVEVRSEGDDYLISLGR